MGEFVNCVVSTHGIAYLTGLVIFLLTLLLAARHVIGLGVTFLFLLFALIAAQSISHQDSIKEYLNTFSQSSSTSAYKAGNAPHTDKVDVNSELQKAFDDLKAEFLIEKEKWQKIYDEFVSQKNSQKESPSTQPKEDKKNSQH